VSERWEYREVERLVRTFDEALTGAMPAVRGVVQKGALNIKTDWRRAWSGHPHAPALPSAVTYDSKATATSASAEIGPDKHKRQGSLGNLFEYGSVHNAPIPGGAPAVAKELPRFERALEDLAAKGLGL